jgi:ubiquitin-protein ligase
LTATVRSGGSGSTKRLLKEYSDFVNEPLPGASVFITENNVYFWKLILEGRSLCIQITFLFFDFAFWV